MGDVNQGSGTSILVAAVVGAAVGAGVALLFAPCSGKDTRGWLANRTRELSDKTTSAFEQGKAAMEINGSWLVPTHEAAGIDLGIAPLPKGPAGLATSINPSRAWSGQPSAFCSRP